MKNIKHIAYVLFITFFAFACTDEPLPYETSKGAFARLTSTDEGTFSFTDTDNSSFTFDLEYYSENDGAEVASNEWFVSHRNNVTGDISAPVMISSMNSSSFGKNENSGLPSATFTFTMNDALTVMGLTIGDVNGRDDFIFDGFVIMNDGRKFGPGNTGGAIQGGAGFDSRFRFIKSLLCPSNLEGIFDYSTIAWCDGTVVNGVVAWKNEGDGIYSLYTSEGEENADFAYGAYFACYPADATLPGTDLQVQDACEILKPIGLSRWGEVYKYNEVTVNGINLTIDWENDYGEAGITTLTRQDGNDWPPLTN